MNAEKNVAQIPTVCATVAFLEFVVISLLILKNIQFHKKNAKGKAGPKLTHMS